MPTGIPMAASAVGPESLAHLVKEEPGALQAAGTNMAPHSLPHYQPGLKDHRRIDEHAYPYTSFGEPPSKKLRSDRDFGQKHILDDHQNPPMPHRLTSPDHALHRPGDHDLARAPMYPGHLSRPHVLTPHLPNSLDTRRHRPFDSAHVLHPHSQHPLHHLHHHNQQNQRSPVGANPDSHGYGASSVGAATVGAASVGASSSLYTNSLDALSFAALHASSDHPGQNRLLSEGPVDSRVELLNSDFALTNGYASNRLDSNMDSAMDSTQMDSSSQMESEDDNKSTAAAERPRKRRCSICNRYFAKLKTHKATHLAEESRPCICDVCGRGFARANDLHRHERSHEEGAAFQCPLFFEEPIPDSPFLDSTLACHKTGRFTRGDTYKNHMKARHFDYPHGTTKRERGGMHGKCKGCGQGFREADAWFVHHIGTSECAGIRRINEARSKGK